MFVSLFNPLMKMKSCWNLTFFLLGNSVPRGGYAQRRGRGMGVYSAKRPMAGPPGMTMGTVAEKNPYSAPKKV
jgi:hypothetical protein